jgi:hypothetical protein
VTESVKIYRLGDDSRFRRAAELSHHESDDVLESPFFPGFDLPLGDLFA